MKPPLPPARPSLIVRFLLSAVLASFFVPAQAAPSAKTDVSNLAWEQIQDVRAKVRMQCLRKDLPSAWQGLSAAERQTLFEQAQSAGEIDGCRSGAAPQAEVRAFSAPGVIAPEEGKKKDFEKTNFDGGVERKDLSMTAPGGGPQAAAGRDSDKDLPFKPVYKGRRAAAPPRPGEEPRAGEAPEAREPAKAPVKDALKLAAMAAASEQDLLPAELRRKLEAERAAKERDLSDPARNLANLPHFKDGTKFDSSELGLPPGQVLIKQTRQGKPGITVEDKDGRKHFQALDGSLTLDEVPAGGWIAQKVVGGKTVVTAYDEKMKKTGQQVYSVSRDGTLKLEKVEAQGFKESRVGSQAPGLWVLSAPEKPDVWRMKAPELSAFGAGSTREAEIRRSCAWVARKLGSWAAVEAPYFADSMTAMIARYLESKPNSQALITFTTDGLLIEEPQEGGSRRQLWGRFEPTASRLGDGVHPGPGHGLMVYVRTLPAGGGEAAFTRVFQYLGLWGKETFTSETKSEEMGYLFGSAIKQATKVTRLIREKDEQGRGVWKESGQAVALPEVEIEKIPSYAKIVVGAVGTLGEGAADLAVAGVLGQMSMIPGLPTDLQDIFRERARNNLLNNRISSAIGENLFGESHRLGKAALNLNETHEADNVFKGVGIVGQGLVDLGGALTAAVLSDVSALPKEMREGFRERAKTNFFNNRISSELGEYFIGDSYRAGKASLKLDNSVYIQNVGEEMKGYGHYALGGVLQGGVDFSNNLPMLAVSIGGLHALSAIPKIGGVLSFGTGVEMVVESVENFGTSVRDLRAAIARDDNEGVYQNFRGVTNHSLNAVGLAYGVRDLVKGRAAPAETAKAGEARVAEAPGEGGYLDSNLIIKMAKQDPKAWEYFRELKEAHGEVRVLPKAVVEAKRVGTKALLDELMKSGEVKAHELPPEAARQVEVVTEMLTKEFDFGKGDARMTAEAMFFKVKQLSSDDVRFLDALQSLKSKTKSQKFAKRLAEKGIAEKFEAPEGVPWDEPRLLTTAGRADNQLVKDLIKRDSAEALEPQAIGKTGLKGDRSVTPTDVANAEAEGTLRQRLSEVEMQKGQDCTLHALSNDLGVKVSEIYDFVSKDPKLGPEVAARARSGGLTYEETLRIYRAVAESRGMGMETVPLEKLFKTIQDRGRGAVVVLEAEGGRHAVYIEGVIAKGTRQYVSLLDSESGGRLYLPGKEFSQRLRSGGVVLSEKAAKTPGLEAELARVKEGEFSGRKIAGSGPAEPAEIRNFLKKARELDRIDAFQWSQLNKDLARKMLRDETLPSREELMAKVAAFEKKNAMPRAENYKEMAAQEYRVLSRAFSKDPKIKSLEDVQEIQELWRDSRNLAVQQADMGFESGDASAITTGYRPNFDTQKGPTCVFHALSTLLKGDASGVMEYVEMARMKFKDPSIGRVGVKVGPDGTRLPLGHGLPVEQVYALGESLGLKKIDAPEILQYIKDTGKPVLTGMAAGTGKHAVVVNGAFYYRGRTFVNIIDSNRAYEVYMPLERFVQLTIMEQGLVAP